MKYLTCAYKIANIVCGILIALYFAFQAVRGFIAGYTIMAIAMLLCSATGCFIAAIAHKEYKQYKNSQK